MHSLPEFVKLQPQTVTKGSLCFYAVLTIFQSGIYHVHNQGTTCELTRSRSNVLILMFIKDEVDVDLVLFKIMRTSSCEKYRSLLTNLRKSSSFVSFVFSTDHLHLLLFSATDSLIDSQQ
jgi:hypothetical protein